MLEEPESLALGLRGVVTAMECKDRPAFPAKKLVQARLPFKRLIPVPKEKTDGHSDSKKSGSQRVSLESKVSDLETSLENLETDCQLNSGVDLTSKLVNGKGPLDNFLTKKVKNQIDQPLVIIDLTEDSNDRLSSPMDHTKLNSEAFSSRETINGIREKDKDLMGPSDVIQNHKVAISEEPRSEDSSATHKNADSGVLKDEDSKKVSLKPFPELICLPKMCSENKQDSWNEVGGILCKGKVPVVVLQDILAFKSLPMASLDESINSESEVLELCPEDDSILSHSSLSSPSSTSSPEGPSISEKKKINTSPLPSTIPVHKVPRKLIKSSTEKEKMRLQRDKERLDKQLKLQAEKEEKEKLKEEAKRAKEEAKKKKEEEKELKEKERREKREKDEKEKAEKLRLKEEKRKERQEALEAKLEEKRKKEEEKRLKEEEKRIKAEKAEITRFFQKPKTPQAPKTLAGSCGKFAPFEIKENMVLAPLCRVVFDQDLSDQFDQLLKDQNSELNFLKDLKCREPHKSGPTLPYVRSPNSINSDIVIVESGKVNDVPERKKFGRMKLLQFSENHRPAYWGTWNKKTSAIRPRNPWSKDSKLLDYEIDSDEEWEEEEPGESLSHSEGDDEDEGGEDEDDDDGFFVPHGYLSEDEGVTEEGADSENHKVRQKLKAKEWDELLAKGKRFRVLQPVKIGCIWEGEKNSNASSELKILQQFTACILDTVVLEEEHTPKTNKREKRDRQILEQLLPLLHGNVNGSKVIIQEFQECCRQGLFNKGTNSPDSGTASPTSPSTSRPQTPTANEDAVIPSKARLKRIISENSVYEKRPDFRMCWYVHLEVLKTFDQEHLPVPCQWNYITQVPSATREDNGSGLNQLGLTQTTPVSLKRKNTGSMSITHFMKKPRNDEQVETVEMDGFQADTEEEEEDDTDCMSMDIPVGSEAKSPSGLDSKFDDGAMETEPSDDPQPVSPSNRT